MVIEDSKNGFESAKIAGLECLKIKDLGNLIEKLSVIDNIPYQIFGSEKINIKIVKFSDKIFCISKKEN